MPWTVRPFRDADFPEVWALERVRDAGGYASAVFVRQAAALWPETFLVADEAGRAIAFAVGAAASAPGTGWILRLKVLEERRRRGIGIALIDGLVERLRGQGVREIRLTVAPENRPALALYRRCGFEDLVLARDHFGPGEDRLVLGRRL